MMDFPDFHTRVSLGYGTSKRLYGTKTITASSTDTIFEITGRGTVYSIFLLPYPDAPKMTDVITVTVDDIIAVDVVWSFLSDNNLVDIHDFPVTLAINNVVDGKYMARITPGYTFEKKYKLSYENTEISDVYLTYQGNYTLVL